MREIKFRVWVEESLPEDTSWMHYCGLLDFDNINGSENIMQYTGFKDKNGKEVFEGDILNINGDNYKAYFDDGCFTTDFSDLRDLNLKQIEIIGNIYENHDLIPNNNNND